MFPLIILAVLVTVWLLWLPYLAKTTKHGAPFVPTEPDIVNRIMELAGVGEKDTFFDLGSGDGRLVIAAARRGAQSIGIEIDPIKVFLVRVRLRFLHLQNARIIHANLFEVDLSPATVVISYLLPPAQKKLKSKLEKELQPGTRVVAVAFPIPGWTPTKTDPHGTQYGPLYLYITK